MANLRFSVSCMAGALHRFNTKVISHKVQYFNLFKI
jgi:hypothetical protein